MTEKLDINLQHYESGNVVDFYTKQSDLQPAEVYLFARHLRPGMTILDLGVGGGRTTSHLAAIAKRYVGIDYSIAMVEAARKRFPGLDFHRCDATEMTRFGESEFDAVIFSFNGIDEIPTDAGRMRCFSEVARVLRPGGVFIYSSHNARQLVLWPALQGARPHQAIWRTIRSARSTLTLLWRALTAGNFRAGKGYVFDPSHGGLRTYTSIPATMRPQLERYGLSLVDVVSGPNLWPRSEAFVCWQYYAAAKSGEAA